MKLNKLLVLLASLSSVQLVAGAPAAYALQISIDPKPLLHGHASAEQTVFDSSFKAGLKALRDHQFLVAEKRLLNALDELRKHNISDERFVKTRTALGWTYLGLDKAQSAQRMFAEALDKYPGGSADQALLGSTYAGMAETLHSLGNPKRAAVYARKAIDINEPLQPLGTNSRELARAYMALGISESALGLDDESLVAYKRAVDICEKAPGMAETDLADALRGVAQEYEKQGKKSEAKEASAQMYEILDRAVKFDRQPAQSNKVIVYWSDGGLRSRQIYDPDYPMKYVWVNGIRIAATLVRSENVIGALISYSNCSRTRLELALGQVQLEELAPLRKPLAYVPPQKLDMALEEEHISALTWRRAWLNHMEKTRRIPGYLHDGLLDVDNFFANNTFGAYGSWGSIAETRTPLLTREQYLYGLNGHKKSELASFLSSTQGGQTSTYLDPGDSKTGLVFFGHERFSQARLKIPVGNLVVEMPFNSAGPR